ncbi:MAG: sigma-70 family RNA polymerase sigma factor [Anaerohalosphaeraceae bacterium]
MPNQNRLLSFILCYIPNRADAEDVFQNTTFVLWKKFDQYKPGSDFLAWSIMIARFEILSYYKKKKSEGSIHFDEEMQKILDAEMKTFESRFEQRLDALRECLKKLITDELRLLKMRYEENLPLARIAERLSITSPAVFKRISKIHSRLIQCIRQRIAFGEAV